MTPSADERLASMIVAMEKIILPELAGSKGLAKEQAGLVLGHLKMLREQLDYSLRYETLELRGVLALSRHLRSIAQQDDATYYPLAILSSAIELAERALAPDEIRAAIEALNNATCELVKAYWRDGNTESYRSCYRLVFDFVKERARVDRAWFAGTGFEPDPSILPDVKTLMQQLEQSNG